MSDTNNSSSNGSASHTPETDKGGNGSDEKTQDTAAADLAKIQEQAEKIKNEYLYLKADFDNYKKNAIKERSDLVKYGAERLARDLLGVLDNLERALAVKVTPETFTTFTKGVELTAQELKKALQTHGIQELPSEGQLFNPNHHEALSSEPSAQTPEGHVLRVFQKAYKYHDKVLRPAHVVVAKKPEA